MSNKITEVLPAPSGEVKDYEQEAAGLYPMPLEDATEMEKYIVYSKRHAHTRARQMSSVNQSGMMNELIKYIANPDNFLEEGFGFEVREKIQKKARELLSQQSPSSSIGKEEVREWLSERLIRYSNMNRTETGEATFQAYRSCWKELTGNEWPDNLNTKP